MSEFVVRSYVFGYESYNNTGVILLQCHYLTCYPRAEFKSNWGLERANLGIGMDLLVLLRYWVQSSFRIILNLVNWNRIRFPQSGQIFAICGVIPKTADSGWLKPMRGRVVWCQMNLQIPEFEHLTVICKYWVIINSQGPARIQYLIIFHSRNFIWWLIEFGSHHDSLYLDHTLRPLCFSNE